MRLVYQLQCQQHTARLDRYATNEALHYKSNAVQLTGKNSSSTVHSDEFVVYITKCTIPSCRQLNSIRLVNKLHLSNCQTLPWTWRSVMVLGLLILREILVF